jgi:hypothetical protein
VSLDFVKTNAYGLAASRVGIGTVALIAPGLLMKIWLGADAKSPPVRAMGMAIGARDLALGIATLHALRAGDAGTLLRCGALADAADAVGTVVALRSSPRDPRMLIALVAAGATALGLWLAGRDPD